MLSSVYLRKTGIFHSSMVGMVRGLTEWLVDWWEVGLSRKWWRKQRVFGPPPPRCLRSKCDTIWRIKYTQGNYKCWWTRFEQGEWDILSLNWGTGSSGGIRTSEPCTAGPCLSPLSFHTILVAVVRNSPKFLFSVYVDDSLLYHTFTRLFLP